MSFNQIRLLIKDFCIVINVAEKYLYFHPSEINEEGFNLINQYTVRTLPKPIAGRKDCKHVLPISDLEDIPLRGKENHNRFFCYDERTMYFETTVKRNSFDLTH